MFGASVFGTTPYASILTYRYIKPASEKLHKLLTVPGLNMGSSAIGRSIQTLRVPNVNTNMEGTIKESLGTLTIPKINTNTNMFESGVEKILYVPGTNTSVKSMASKSAETLTVPGVNIDIDMFGSDAEKVLHVPETNTGSGSIPED